MPIALLRCAAVFLIALSCRAAELDRKLDALIEAGVPAGMGFAGVQVVELTGGKTLYRHNESQLFLPASNMKLLTSGLALSRLGADYRYTTRVVRETSGDVVIVASGDPTLSGRSFPYQKDSPMGPPLGIIEDLADQAVAHGLREVNGDVVGDDRLYPWVPYPPSWTQDDETEDFGAPVSALTITESFLTLTAKPGSHPGDLASLSIVPDLEYYAIDNRILTVTRGQEGKIHMQRLPGSRQILLWGSIPAGAAGLSISTAIDDPALYAADAFYDALTRRGVIIRGRPLARHRTPSEVIASSGAEATSSAIPEDVIGSHTSPPLRDLLQTMNKVSQNLYAELILREVGRVARQAGTREAGLAELGTYVGEIGGAAKDLHAEDGSGLSRNTLVTPRILTKVLTHMYDSPDRDLFISLLPVGGEDGTLSTRLCCVSEGRGVRAKTGSLARALALSGYADSKTYGRVAFSILVNDFGARPSEVRQWIDKIATALLD